VGLTVFQRANEVSIDGQVILIAMVVISRRRCSDGSLPLSFLEKRIQQTLFMRMSETGTTSKAARRTRPDLVVAQIGFAFHS